MVPKTRVSKLLVSSATAGSSAARVVGSGIQLEKSNQVHLRP